MDVIDKYNIVFSGLAVGVHEFEFDVDDAFFAAFEGSEITNGNLTADVVLTKHNNMLTMDVNIDGEVSVTCDRCLDDFMMPVTYSGTLFVKFSEEPVSDESSDEDVMWLMPGDTEINPAQYIYESITLSLPYQRIHPEDAEGRSTCNPDMLKRFKIVSEDEFETMFEAEPLSEESPEAWSKLAELKSKLEEEEK